MPAIRADAANTLSRARYKKASDDPLRSILRSEPIRSPGQTPRARSGPAEDKEAFDLLLNAAIEDKDSRVRVSAIRSLGRAAEAMSRRQAYWSAAIAARRSRNQKTANPLGKKRAARDRHGSRPAAAGDSQTIRSDRFSKRSFAWRTDIPHAETEIALARVSPVALFGRSKELSRKLFRRRLARRIGGLSGVRPRSRRSKIAPRTTSQIEMSGSRW